MTTDVTDKSRGIRSLIDAIEEQCGQGSILRLGEGNEGDNQAPTAVIHTGSLALDDALGIGGYPRGRVLEIYGPEASGKTTLALHAVREMQHTGGVAAYLDAEHALDVTYARSVGVDLERLLVSQPDNAEQGLEIVEVLTRSGAVDLVVVDSVAALTPRAEIDGEMGDVGLQARLMSQALRKLTAVASRTGTTVIFTNPLRARTGIVFGTPESTAGGNALKFYASVRLDTRRLGPVTEGEAIVGSRIRVRVVKNRMAAPFREAEVDIRWGTGIDALADLLDVAIRFGVVEKNGEHLSFAGVPLGHGHARAQEALRQEELAARLRDAVASRSLGNP